MKAFTVLPQQKDRIAQQMQTQLVIPQGELPEFHERIQLKVRTPGQPDKLLAIVNFAGTQRLIINERGGVTIAGVAIDFFDVRDVALDLGFIGADAFKAYIKETYGLPFDGHLLHFYKAGHCYA